jgi:hypothetical protein
VQAIANRLFRALRSVDHGHAGLLPEPVDERRGVLLTDDGNLDAL